TTPFIGLSIGEIFQEAGIPDGVFNVINSRANIAEHLIQHPDIEIVMFTGSVGIGKRVMQLASQNLTKIVLELGGKDPMIVLKDADIEKAAKGAVWGAFMNAGQSCVAVERVYVEEEIAEKFIAKVSEITKNLKTGNPLDSETAIGPLTTKNQLETVEEHVEDAKSKGAKILFGGERINELPGYFYQPTVLTNVNHSMEIMTEETFGLVLPIMKVKNKEEAVKLANDSKYGLSASVWTKNKKIAARIAKKLQAGTITVNDVISYWGEPAGLLTGVKNSGLGRSHGKFGLLELVNIKFISIDSSNRKTQLWWYPYNRKFFEMMKKSLDLFYSHRLNIKMKSLFSLLSHLERIKKGTSIWNLIKNWRKIIF
ncbi:MAG: aldehyde dehydrogenase family protein, partial [Candidatus Aminicenantia bacterium]